MNSSVQYTSGIPKLRGLGSLSEKKLVWGNANSFLSHETLRKLRSRPKTNI